MSNTFIIFQNSWKYQKGLWDQWIKPCPDLLIEILIYHIDCRFRVRISAHWQKICVETNDDIEETIQLHQWYLLPDWSHHSSQCCHFQSYICGRWSPSGWRGRWGSPFCRRWTSFHMTSGFPLRPRLHTCGWWQHPHRCWPVSRCVDATRAINTPPSIPCHFHSLCSHVEVILRSEGHVTVVVVYCDVSDPQSQTYVKEKQQLQ